MNEIRNEMSYITKILSDSVNTEYSLSKKTILVKHRLNSLLDNLNSLNELYDLNIEEINSFYNEILEQISSITISEESKTNDISFLNFERLRYGLVSTLINSWGKGGFLRITGSAQALSNLLLGFQDLDYDAIIVDYNHPEFVSRFFLVINLLNSRANMYLNTSLKLYTISKENLILWSSQALLSYQKLLDIYQNYWNFQEFSRIEKRGGKSFLLDLFRTTFDIFNNMILNLISLYARSGSTLLLDKNISFYRNESDEIFLKSLNEISSNLLLYFSYFETYSQSKKDQLIEEPIYKSIVTKYSLFTKFTKLLIDGYFYLSKIINSDKPVNSSDFHSHITDIISALEKHNKLFNDPRFVFSRSGELIVNYLVPFILFPNFLGKVDDRIKYLLLIEKNIGKYFSQEGIERYPQLYSLFLVGILKAYISQKDRILAQEISNTLLETSEYFLYHSRDEFAFFLSASLVKFLLGRQSFGKFLNSVEKKIESLEDFFDKQYIQEINTYLVNVKKAVNSEKSSFISQRDRTTNLFDGTSILKLDLTELCHNQGYEEIIHTPFNLQNDFLITKEE